MTEDDLEPQLSPLRERFLRQLKKRLPPDAAEDVVQETLLALWQAHATIQGSEAARYGSGILRNKWRRHWREAARHTFEPLDQEDGQPREIAVDAAQEAAVMTQLVEQALAALPEAWRGLFVDVVVLGVSLEAAAGTHGIPIGTVKSRVNRAKQALRHTLEGGRAPRFRSAA